MAAVNQHDRHLSQILAEPRPNWRVGPPAGRSPMLKTHLLEFAYAIRKVRKQAERSEGHHDDICAVTDSVSLEGSSLKSLIRQADNGLYRTEPYR
jgi:hypothetical protein